MCHDPSGVLGCPNHLCGLVVECLLGELGGCGFDPQLFHTKDNKNDPPLHNLIL